MTAVSRRAMKRSVVMLRVAIATVRCRDRGDAVDPSASEQSRA
jgi:hypothetical protein